MEADVVLFNCNIADTSLIRFLFMNEIAERSNAKTIPELVQHNCRLHGQT